MCILVVPSVLCHHLPSALQPGQSITSAVHIWIIMIQHLLIIKYLSWIFCRWLSMDPKKIITESHPSQSHYRPTSEHNTDLKTDWYRYIHLEPSCAWINISYQKCIILKTLWYYVLLVCWHRFSYFTDKGLKPTFIHTFLSSHAFSAKTWHTYTGRRKQNSLPWSFACLYCVCWAGLDLI